MTERAESQPISFLPVPERDEVPEGVARLWDKSQEAFGFVPNVFRAQAVNGDQFLAWWGYFNLLLNKEGHLTNAERELVAVVVSGLNGCTYCAVSHGAALREYSGDARTADLAAVNWRQADLPDRKRAIAEYAELLTRAPDQVGAEDLAPLREVGMDDHEIMELVQVIGMFNMTNRVSSALGFVPNEEYHSMARP
ncbi:peroxidase-related enzyme [Ornithinicoccus hortensis]|uniref:Putative peroxidase-related enzyme n=1 Tax=Ornithinicoccus hortensis TaxID=82346 RepID=A0A542YUZ8_9MICO|nr:peroxidase-related enzyme [Ornithinicoccus hortensis]TQL51905.1 putative peroxidase-related enzyme [Ornithinicoccus hortensis]